MEIDVVYLTALIEECGNPIAVLQRSNLSGDREDAQGARNSLLKHFEQPRTYNQETHAEHLAALGCLGVDVPAGEAVNVVAFRQVNTSSDR